MTDAVTERFGNKKTSGDYSNYSIIRIGLNTERSPDNLRRLIIAQNSVKNYSKCWFEKFSKEPLNKSEGI